jgi:hypothetical protein
LLVEKIGARVSKFLQWLARGSADSPPCHG